MRSKLAVGLSSSLILAGLFSLLAALLPAQSVVSTVAGGAATGPGDGGAASLAFLNKPTGVTCSNPQGSPSCGNLIIVDQADQRIRQVTANGIISTLAGTGMAGFQDGAAAQAAFNFPESAMYDAKGNLYVTEVVGHRLRKIDPSGNVTTVAGNGTDGDSGDGCPATNATFHQLFGIAIDGSGNVYVSDSQANRVRRITVSTGCIATILGTGAAGFAGDGTASATLNGPQGLAYDPNSDTLYVVDSGNNRVRTLSHVSTGANSVVNTFAGCGNPGVTAGCTGTISSKPTTATASPLFNPQAVAIGPDGVYVLDAVRFPGQIISLIYRIDNTGTMTLLYTLGNGNGFSASSLTVISQTQIYVTETLFSRTVQLVTGAGPQKYAGGGLLDGAQSSSAGIIGPISTCPLSAAVTCEPAGIKTDQLGNIYISDFGENRVRKISPSGVITTVAGNGLLASSGDGGSALLASIAGPLGIDFDASGNLYIAEAFTSKVRMVSAATGNISTFAGTGNVGQCAATCPGDGGQATSAGLFNPTAVAVNRSTGSVYIADNGNSRIRVVNSAGVISTYAGMAATNLCNGGVSLSCGDGGPATSATLAGPVDLVLDGSGNLYILERFVQVSLASSYAGARIRKVTASSGVITTIAGNGGTCTTSGCFYDANGEGSAALSASLGTPSGLAIDPNNGNLFVSDDRNHRILRVNATVTRIVGIDGMGGFNGDGQPPTVTQILRPQGLALDAGGNLLFWDTGNNRIRKVPGIGTVSPETMQLLSGNHQTANVGTVLPQKIAVQVLQGTTGVAGVVVQFAVAPANSATLSSSSVTTDSTGTASITVTVGASAGTFTITASSTGLPAVTFTESALSVVNAATNGASFAVTPLAPGSIASLFGMGMAASTDTASSTPLPTTLAGGTSVSIIGSTKTYTAPLYYASPTQINFQLPFEVTDSSVSVVVATGGSNAPPLPLAIAATSPGIFTINTAGQGAILHGTGYGLVSAANPATAGEVVLIYCTGLGAVTPTLTSGVPTPNNGTLYNATMPTVSIGGMNAVVSFAGLAPSFVGLYQINAVVPSVTPGSTIPVVVTANGVASNTAIIQVH